METCISHLLIFLIAFSHSYFSRLLQSSTCSLDWILFVKYKTMSYLSYWTSFLMLITLFHFSCKKAVCCINYSLHFLRVFFFFTGHIRKSRWHLLMFFPIINTFKLIRYSLLIKVKEKDILIFLTKRHINFRLFLKGIIFYLW